MPLTTLATWVPPTEDLALRIVGDACAAILFLHEHGCHLPALDLASLYVVGATGPPWELIVCEPRKRGRGGVRDWCLVGRLEESQSETHLHLVRRRWGGAAAVEGWCLSGPDRAPPLLRHTESASAGNGPAPLWRRAHLCDRLRKGRLFGLVVVLLLLL